MASTIRKISCLFCACGMSALLNRPVFADAGQNPVDLVNAAYRALASDHAEIAQGWMTPRFHADMEKERQCEERLGDGRYGYLFASGQDIKISAVVIRTIFETNVEQRVLTTFKNFDMAQKRVFVFVRAARGWLLDDVMQDEGSTRALVKRPCRL